MATLVFVVILNDNRDISHCFCGDRAPDAILNGDKAIFTFGTATKACFYNFTEQTYNSII